MSQSVIEALGPVAQAVMQFEQSLVQAILEGLAATEAALAKFESDLKVQIATQLTPAILATTKFEGAITDSIRTQLAQTAETLSAATESPVLLSSAPPAMGGEAASPQGSRWPGQWPWVPFPLPGLPPGGPPGSPVPVPIKPPAAVPGGPQPTPIYPAPSPGPVFPPPTAPPQPVFPPSQPPTGPYVPGQPYPGMPATQPVNPYQPKKWSSEAAPGPVASPLAPPLSGGAMVPAVAGPGQGKAPGTPISVAGYGTSQIAGAGSGAAGLQGEPPECPPGSAPVWNPAPGPYPGYGWWICQIQGEPTPEPTPTPTPEPTPTPTPTPTPVDTCPPPEPCPTPPPCPEPPTCPTCPVIVAPIDQPPDCPPTFHPQWHPTISFGGEQSGYWTCEPDYIAPLPPIPTPPEPTPTPTPVVNVETCGQTRSSPCFVAANPPDDDQDYPCLHLTSGGGRLITDAGSDTIEFQVNNQATINIQGGIIDQADFITGCEQPYQFQLVAASCNFKDTFKFDDTILNALDTALGGKSIAARTIMWGVLYPLVIIAKFIMAGLEALICAVMALLQGFSANLASVAFGEFWFNVLNLITGFSLRKHKKILTYSNDYNQPITIPSPPDAAQAWLANEIDDCTFVAWVRSGDMRFDPFKAVTRSSKFKFTALELMTLEKRHKLERSTIDTRLRELGSLEAEDKTELESLFTQLPGPSDIIRFMVRDVENADTVNTFQMDTGFGDNYRGKLKDYADMQGVDEDYMRREWRAHWKIPSPTQLYVMLHRYRHGDDPSKGGDILSDVRKALIQDDNMPYWIDRLMGISYLPITRTDLIRAYERGWIDDDAYKTGIYNDGYSDDDAEKLLRFARQERLLAIRRADFLRAYADGLIDDDELKDWAAFEGYDDSLMDEVVQAGSYLRIWSRRKEQVHALATRFRQCRISEDEMREDARQLGIPDRVIDNIVETSGINTTCGTRREMIGTLCQALDQELITPREYVERARKMKYDDVAIDHYLTLCQNKIAARKAKEEAKRIKEAEKEAEKEAKAEAKAERQAEAQARRAARQAQTLERARQARNKVLEETTSNVIKNLSLESPAAAAVVAQIYEDLQARYGLSQNEAANAVRLAASKVKGGTVEDLFTWSDDVARAALSEPWSLFAIAPSP